MNKDPKTVYKIYVQGSVLKANVIVNDALIDKLDNANEINRVLETIYLRENTNLLELIKDKRVVISSSKVWDKYQVTANKYFTTLVKEGEKTPPVKEDNPPKKDEDDDDTKDSPKRVKLRSVGTKILLWSTFGVMVYAGIAAIINHVNKNSTRNYVPPTNDDEDQYRVTINDNGNIYTYNMKEDDLVQEAYKPEAYKEEKTNDDSNTYDYTSYGSSIGYEELNVQLDSIDRCTIHNVDKLYQFEILVVNDDVNAVKAFSDMRNDVINGVCSPEDFCDTMIKYIFENGSYINGNFVERYHSTHPYAQYIFVRGTQGILGKCHDYNRNGYDFNAAAELLENTADDLRRVLEFTKGK